MNDRMKIYCINLQRSFERRKSMENEFSRHGLACEFVEAVDGALLTEDEIHHVYSLWRTILRRGCGLTKAEIGCAMSHIRLWKHIVANNEVSIVFEDDIKFGDGIKVGLKEIVSFLNAEKGPSLVKMSGWPGGNNETGKFIISNGLTGAYAYGLNVEAAKLLINANTPITGPIDLFGDMVRHFHLGLYSYDKSIVRLGIDVNSTIGAERFTHGSKINVLCSKILRGLGALTDRLSLVFEGAPRKCSVYAYKISGPVYYTRSANAYQKMRLVTENLHGVLLRDAAQNGDKWPEFKYALMHRIPVGRMPIYCMGGSAEKEFVKIILYRLLLRRQMIIFCWDPPGVYWRDRKDLLARIRVWVLSQLQSMAIMCSKSTIFNLHRGFAERYLWKSALKKCAFFPNGTCVADNQKVADGVKHVPHRIAISNTFMAGKGCFWLADRLIEVKRQVPDLSVVWVGADHGDLAAVRERLLSGGFSPSDLVHLGPAKHADALRYWASADIGFNAYPDQPSVKWNYVLKIPEFMSLGLPVVSVDLPGAHEYITPDIGALFAPDDAGGAVHALCSFLLDDNQLATYRAAAIERVEEFDWSVINKKIATTIKQKCEEQNGQK